jgi:hypothetical protein
MEHTRNSLSQPFDTPTIVDDVVVDEELRLKVDLHSWIL